MKLSRAATILRRDSSLLSLPYDQFKNNPQLVVVLIWSGSSKEEHLVYIEKVEISKFSQTTKLDWI